MKKIYLVALTAIFSVLSTNLYAQLLGLDVPVLNLPITNQVKPDVDVAFNGWVYDAYSIDTGFVVRVSRNGGTTWTTIDQHNDNTQSYRSVKLAVASNGTDTQSIRVFVMVLDNDMIDFLGQIFINTYNGYNDSYLGQNFYASLNDTVYRSIDIATDAKFPAVGASPYSVAAAYTINDPTIADSVMLLVSTDSGATYPNVFTVDTTNLSFRNVSIAYGKSASGSNGRYFIAWDEFDTDAALDGRIFESRNSTTITSTTIAPVRIDTANINATNKARKPFISVSANNTDNDSSGVTAIVAFESDFNGDGSDIDIVAGYNKVAHFTDYWSSLTINGSANITQTPSLSFEPVNNNFYCTYFDSSNKRLVLVKNDFNLETPSPWPMLSNNYADDSLVLTTPYPIVGIDPTHQSPVMTWSSPLVLNGVVLFDVTFGNNPLAIKTSAITATNVGTHNRVDWTTATEDANSSFVIERSADGDNFAAIGTIKANGRGSDYTYWDEAPVAGMNYYRVRTTDVNNAVSYTRVVSAFVKGGSTFTLHAYPNPVASSLSVYVSAQGANGRVTVSDLSGKIMMQQQVNGTETKIDMSHLAAGIYIVKYADDSNSEVIRINKN